ncbi:50S ribosomal protein L29, partial [Patescibacteria group bacterium]
MKAKDLRTKNNEELKKILVEKKEELSKLRFDIALSQIKEHRDY